MKFVLKNNDYNLIYMLFLFIFLSIIGGILEISYMLIVEERFVIGGFFNAPIRPIYGFGGLILYLLPKILKENKTKIFISSFITCSIFEYISSFFLEKMFNKKFWDYSKFLLNINGRICLLHSIIWGFLGIVFISIIEPYIFKMYGVIRQKKLEKYYD